MYSVAGTATGTAAGTAVGTATKRQQHVDDDNRCRLHQSKLYYDGDVGRTANINRCRLHQFIRT